MNCTLIASQIYHKKMDNFSLDKAYSMYENIITEGKKAEENCIKLVLKEYLKREPSMEDAKKVTRLFVFNQSDRYILEYDNEPLGTVELFSSHKFIAGIPENEGVAVNFFPGLKFLETIQ